MLISRKQVQVRTLIIRDFAKVFEKYDLILGPTAPAVAYDLGTQSHDPVTMYLADLLTIPVNLAELLVFLFQQALRTDFRLVCN